MYPHIHILSLYIPTYGISMGVGLLLALLHIYRKTSSIELFSQFIWFLFLFEMVGYTFARLSSMVFFQSDVGTSIIGYQFAFIPVLLLYTRVIKVDLLPFVTLAIPALLIIQIFGKLGCFLAGCCGGIYSTTLLFPLQLFVAATLTILLMIVRKIFNKSIKNILLTYFLGYFLIRFTEEFFRVDSIQFGSLLTVGQS